MNRRVEQPKGPPPGFVDGSVISLEEWHTGKLAIDHHGSLYCYLGYRDASSTRSPSLHGVRLGADDPKGRASFRFVSLSEGSLRYAAFFPDHAYYKVLSDRRLVLPGVADFYFGVRDSANSAEDIELTRALFGATTSELQLAVQSFASIIGRNVPSYSTGLRPRVTCSGQGDNHCDITNCLIPMNFPYVCLSDSQYLWGHISLSGFYRTLALIAGKAGAVRSALLDAGLTEELLGRFIARGTNQHMLLMDEHGI